MTKQIVALLSLCALCALPALAQEKTKNEAPKNRVFLWGDKPTDVGELSPLFDGQTLKNWTPRGGAKYNVENGELIGTTGNGKYGWLISDKPYGDFVLEAENEKRRRQFRHSNSQRH